MTYKMTSNHTVIRTIDNALIPADPGNRDWQEYQAWLEAGNMPNPVDEPALDDAKAGALAEIDRQGGERRLIYITAIPGQDGTYIAKQNEALAWVAAGSPALGFTGFPYAEAEAAMTGDTVAETLATYRAQSDMMNAINAQLEAVRISKKREVMSAQDVAAVQAILANLEWPQP